MGKTITECLAEIKTIEKRLVKKRAFVLEHLTINQKMKDPFEESGGSPKVLKAERDSIRDLEDRIVKIRSAINRSNQSTELTIDGAKKTVAEWLVWRREVAPAYSKFLASMSNAISSKRLSMQSDYAYNKDAGNDDVVVHVDERELGSESENLEDVLGSLDGKLSLLNATTVIDV